MVGLFFSLAFVNTILDNLKDTLVITAVGGGTEVLPYLSVYGVLPCSLLFLVAYSYASQYLSRAAMFNGIIALFSAFFAVFTLYLYPNHEALHLTALGDTLTPMLPSGLVGAVGMLRNWTFTLFFCVAELFGDVGLGLLFWGLANDTTSMQDAPVLYPMFGIGANLAQAAAGTLLRSTCKRTTESADSFSSDLRTMMLVVLCFSGAVIALHSYINHASKKPHRARKAAAAAASLRASSTDSANNGSSSSSSRLQAGASSSSAPLHTNHVDSTHHHPTPSHASHPLSSHHTTNLSASHDFNSHSSSVHVPVPQALNGSLHARLLSNGAASSAPAHVTGIEDGGTHPSLARYSNGNGVHPGSLHHSHSSRARDSSQNGSTCGTSNGASESTSYATQGSSNRVSSNGAGTNGTSSNAAGSNSAADGAGSKKAVRARKKRMRLGDVARILSSSIEIRCLAVMALAQGLCSSLVEFSWKSHMRLLYPSPQEFTAFLGDVATCTGVVTGSLMLLSPLLFSKLGWRGVAATTPTIMTWGGGAFFAACIGFQYFFGAGSGAAAAASHQALQVLVVGGAVLYVFSRGAKFSLFKPAEEMVYIGLGEEGRTKGKAAIDVVGAQAGKAGGSVLQQGLLLMSGGLLSGALPVMGIVFIAMTRGWIGSVNKLADTGKAFAHDSSQDEDDEQEEGEAQEDCAAAGRDNRDDGASGGALVVPVQALQRVPAAA